MPEKTLGSGTDAGRGHFTNGHEPNTHYNTGNSGRGAYVRSLAKPASRLFLAIRVSVRGYLKKEDQGKQRQSKSQRPCRSSPGFTC
jgi:hypothetical protein